MSVEDGPSTSFDNADNVQCAVSNPDSPVIRLDVYIKISVSRVFILCIGLRQ